MPSVFGLVAQGVLRPSGEHPEIDARQCIVSRQGKVACTACRELCPAQIITEPQKGKADWAKCVNCGICAAGCPAQAISFPEYQQKQLLRMLADGRGAHVIGCSQAQGGMDHRVWCLAACPWEMIAALALVGRVELMRGDCEGCPRGGRGICLEETLEDVRRFLGESRFGRQVKLLGEGERAAYGVSRRELFARLLPGEGRKQGPAKDMACSRDGQAMRMMLLETMKREKQRGQTYGFAAPKVGPSCWACGICERMCPTRAIRMQQQDGQWYAVTLPVLCTGCGVCEAVCPSLAIDGIDIVQMKAGEYHRVQQADADSCEACGAAIRKNALSRMCTRCQALKRKK